MKYLPSGQTLGKTMSKTFLYLTVGAALMAAPAFADSTPSMAGCNASANQPKKCDAGDSSPVGDGSGYNADSSANKHDQTATSEVRVDEYLNASLVDGDGFSSVTMEMNQSGEVEDATFTRRFRIASNADHEVQIWYDAISVDDVCVPVFDSEGTGSVAGEADVIGGSITLKVGDTILFSASAGDDLDNLTNETSVQGVSIQCDDASEVGVEAAVVTLTNKVASTFSREYTLEVRAFGENGSIIFADGEAINAGDAPAGQYDNDILIAAGTLNTYTYDDENDAYAGAAFDGKGATFYGQES